MPYSTLRPAQDLYWCLPETRIPASIYLISSNLRSLSQVFIKCDLHYIEALDHFSQVINIRWLFNSLPHLCAFLKSHHPSVCFSSLFFSNTSNHANKICMNLQISVKHFPGSVMTGLLLSYTHTYTQQSLQYNSRETEIDWSLAITGFKFLLQVLLRPVPALMPLMRYSIVSLVTAVHYQYMIQEGGKFNTEMEGGCPC